MSFTVPPGPLAPVVRLDDYRSELPAEPPVDATQVWGEVMAAAQLFGELRDAGMSVRFDVEDPTLPPRVRITDLEGRTIREISPAVACDPRLLHDEILGGVGA
jgi:hypothetical protein